MKKKKDVYVVDNGKPKDSTWYIYGQDVKLIEDVEAKKVLFSLKEFGVQQDRIERMLKYLVIQRERGIVQELFINAPSERAKNRWNDEDNELLRQLPKVSDIVEGK